MTAIARRSIGLVIMLTLATFPAFAQEARPKGKVQNANAKPSARKPKLKAVEEVKPDPTLRNVAPKFVLRGHEFWAYDLNFSPDGKTLASVGDEDGTLRLWDTATGQQLSVFTKNSRLLQLSFAPDGKSIATTSFYWDLKAGRRVVKSPPDYTVELWDIAAGKEKVIVTTPEAILGIRYSPDGKSLAITTAGSTDRTFLWDIATAEKGITFRYPAEYFNSFSYDIAFSPDGSVVATTEGEDVMLWDTKTGNSIGPLVGNRYEPFSIAFSPNGQWIATGGYDNTIRVWYPGNRSLRVCLISRTKGCNAS